MVAADAYDVARVDFLIDQQIVMTDTMRPYAFQLDTTSVPDGARTLRARGVDASGNATTSSRPIVIDNAEPETSIVKGPRRLVRTTTPVFYFESEPGATFTCSLDGAPFRVCAEPAVYANLPDGRHVFRVRAQDAAGRIDKSPASRAWRIDLRAPKTVLERTKTTSSAPGRATFAFSAGEPATFRCSLDGAAWTRCASPIRYRRLLRGAHTFRVRAVDTAGNLDKTPARFAWTVARGL
jgi:hypothetical protein